MKLYSFYKPPSIPGRLVYYITGSFLYPLKINLFAPAISGLADYIHSLAKQLWQNPFA